MSAGMAVVSTIHAGIPMAVKNDQNGLLVAERDNEGLEDAIHRLISNETLRKTFGISARKTIVEKFSSQKMRDHLVQVLASVN
jgi:colanic acid/amylovoran biosynthesis glycosyltransferase